MESGTNPFAVDNNTLDAATLTCKRLIDMKLYPHPLICIDKPSTAILTISGGIPNVS
jgi:hypothetical protein